MQGRCDGAGHSACWRLVLAASEAVHNAVLPAQSLATVTLRNSGERHLKASGRLVIRRADDRLATTVSLPTLQTLPGASMTTRVALPALPRGTSVPRVIVEYGGTSAAAERRRELH